MEYIFIHGRDPEISKLELECYLKARGVNYTITGQSETATIMQIDEEDILKINIDGLGGIIKIGRVIEIGEAINYFQDKRAYYGISNYEANREQLNKFKGELRKHFKTARIKAKEKKARNHQFLQAQECLNLIKKGIEIIIADNKIAKTIAVYNFLEQKKRDECRPARKYPLAISIRLAKIMINLAGAVPGNTMLDPFCGIGTIMQEALVQGINAVGIDNSKENISAAEKNLRWLTANYKLPTASYKLYNADARQSSSIAKEQVDYIITEPYLGPFLRTIPYEKEALKIKCELLPLYKRVFEQFAIIKPKRVVIIMPIFQTKEGRAIRFGLHEISNRFKLVYAPLFYRAGGKNVIAREIWILEQL